MKNDLSSEILDLKREISVIQLKLFRLSNPPKYKIGDTVIVNEFCTHCKTQIVLGKICSDNKVVYDEINKRYKNEYSLCYGDFHGDNHLFTDIIISIHEDKIVPFPCKEIFKELSEAIGLEVWGCKILAGVDNNLRD